jgi:hypothetical protein
MIKYLSTPRFFAAPAENEAPAVVVYIGSDPPSPSFCFWFVPGTSSEDNWNPDYP